MIKKLMKDKLFMISFLFLATMLLLSFANTLFNNGNIRQVSIVMDGKGKILAIPPFPPSAQFLLGTDRGGFDMLHMIVQGAKFTIGIALFIVVLRLLFSIVIGTFLGLYLQKWIPRFEKLFDVFTVVPLTLIAYFILLNVFWMPVDGFAEPFWKRAVFEVFILTVFALPTLSFFVANDIKNVFQEDFIDAAQVIGASKVHIMIKHIFPHVVENWILMLPQQFVQVLIIMGHLGVLQLFFGGTYIDYMGFSPPKTISYEWSGLIGDSYQALSITPWIPLVPIVFLALTVISSQLILNGIKRAFEARDQEIIKKMPAVSEINETLEPAGFVLIK
jgi:peptide/nickel transport system permease protein